MVEVCSMKSYSMNHIDVWVNSSEYDKWRFTGVYGDPEEDQKYKTGLLLAQL